MKKPEEFREQAIKKRINKWNITKCCFCNRKFGFFFYDDYNKVNYDHSCDCNNFISGEIMDWKNVADFYNKITNIKSIKKMNEFWEFKD